MQKHPSALKWIAVAIVGVVYIFTASRLPYGEWDAWARWNAMARQLHYHDPVTLIRTLAPFTTHLEYPPLLYIVHAALLAIFGDTPIVAIALHGLVLLTITALMRPWWLALIVGVACVYYAAIQYADLPLAMFFLLASVACRHKREAWAGFALGLGALTKNEGLIILVAMMALWMVCERRVVWRAWAGAAIPLLLLVAWKLVIPETNDVIAAGGIMQRITGWSRYAVIIPYVITGLLNWSTGAVLIVSLIAVIRGRRVDTLLMAVVGAVWLVYVGIYVITPYDLTYHLSTSYDRLLVHLFPVFAYALLGNSQTS